MGNARSLVPILLAIIIALLSSLFLYKWMKGQATVPKTTEKKETTMKIAVASKPVPIGSKLKSELIKMVPYAEESLPEGYFVDPQKIEGRIVLTALSLNEPVLEKDLAPNVSNAGISSLIKKGKRAIAIKGNKIMGLSGLIQPGDRVDVLMTHIPKNSKKTEMNFTKVILENILVLATGHHIVPEKDGKPSSTEIYTLEVSLEVGEKLIAAASLGKLQLALRNPVDHQTVLTVGALGKETMDGFRPIVAQEKKTPKKSRAKRKYRIPTIVIDEIRGDDRVEVEVKDTPKI